MIKELKRKRFSRETGWIQTFKRRKFWPLNPRVEDIDIEDIAHGLSGEGRFTNQTEETYSVAQHSVMVAWLLASRGEPVGVQLQGLLHDGDEAYIPDLARPVKHQLRMEEYRNAGKRIQKCIFRKYGLPIEELPIVKQVDEYLLSIEAQQLFRGGPLPGWWRKLHKVTGGPKIVPWDRAKAKRIFLNEFQNLINGIGRNAISKEKSEERVRLARRRGQKLLSAGLRVADRPGAR